jgi:hypothetical protein
MLTDGTDNPQPTKEYSRQRDSKPPLIIVYRVKNFNDIAHLSAIIEEEQYHCKVIANDTIKIYVATPESYRKLIKHLQKKQTPWPLVRERTIPTEGPPLVEHLQEDKFIYHTYEMKQERAHRIVIRNQHYSTPTAQITAELEKQGHKMQNILNVKHRITKESLSLFFIDLEPKKT